MEASGWLLAWVAVQTRVREAPRAKTIAKQLKIHALQLRSPRGPCVVPRCRAYHETHLQIESTRL